MEQQVQDIEIRLRRLEQLHVWGATIVAFGLVAFLIYKNEKN